jgi:predicted kinase
MSESVTVEKPSLIVVTGRPGSGKTQLVHLLARAVRCPAICRDELKEGLVNTTARIGTPGDNLDKEIYGIFFDTLRLLLSHRITLIAEAAFQHKLWAPKLEPLREMARIRIVLCSIDPQLARKRHIERGLADSARERFHLDRPVQAAREGRDLPIDPYDAPHLDVPMFVVDTTDGYRPSLEEIASFARD